MIGAILDGSVTDSSVELVHEFLVASRILEEIVEYGCEADGGGLGAGESHADGHGENSAVVEKVGAVFFRFEEHGEEVSAADCDGLLGIDGVGVSL